MSPKIRLKVKDTSYTQDGVTYPGDLSESGETEWIADPANCPHKMTVCVTCLSQWSEGYWVNIDFGHGASFSLNDPVELQRTLIEMLSPLLALGRDMAWRIADGLQMVTDSLREAFPAPEPPENHSEPT